MITVLHRGGYAQMITILHRGGGSLGTPKSDYVICARPLIELSWTANKGKSLHNKIIWSVKGGKEEEKAAVMNCQKCKNGGSQIGVDDT